MAIESANNIHAALTIYAATDMGPASPTPVPANDPPRFDELPAVNSLGCVAYDLRQLFGPHAVGGYLVKLDYPLSSSQCAVHVTPFGYFTPDDMPIVPEPGRQYVIHIDDTFKVIVSLAVHGHDIAFGPTHVTFINFDPIPTVERLTPATGPLPLPSL